MRIAIAEIGQETCSFTPVRTTLETFRQYGLYEGEAMFSQRPRGRGTLDGLLAAVRNEGVHFEPVPIISAWAGAGGPLAHDTLAYFVEKVTAGLAAAGRLDGFFFSLHGAAAAEDEPDVEGALLAAARAVIGDGVPIVAPLDHHANMTARMMQHLDALVAHRTQPHDPYDTGYQAAKLLFATLRGELAPVMAWHKIPMISHQEQYLTSRGPMQAWFDRARELEQVSGVASISTFPMQCWLDVPEGGWATVVVTHADDALARRVSAELAEMAWELRAQFWVYESVAVEEAVRRARAGDGLTILSDTGDSVFGGATGDSTAILTELLRQDGGWALVPVVDAEATQAAWAAGRGATLTLPLGGKLDPRFGKPVTVTAHVADLAEGVLEAEVVGVSSFDMGKTACLEIGTTQVVVSEQVGVGGNHPVVYRRFGVEPAAAQAVVLKTASNFQYYTGMAREVIRVDTPGPTMSHLERFAWQHTPRPIYPLDALEEWHPRTTGLGAKHDG